MLQSAGRSSELRDAALMIVSSAEGTLQVQQTDGRGARLPVNRFIDISRLSVATASSQMTRKRPFSSLCQRSGG